MLRAMRGPPPSHADDAGWPSARKQLGKQSGRERAGRKAATWQGAAMEMLCRNTRGATLDKAGPRIHTILVWPIGRDKERTLVQGFGDEGGGKAVERPNGARANGGWGDSRSLRHRDRSAHIPRSSSSSCLPGASACRPRAPTTLTAPCLAVWLVCALSQCSSLLRASTIQVQAVLAKAPAATQGGRAQPRPASNHEAWANMRCQCTLGYVWPLRPQHERASRHIGIPGNRRHYCDPLGRHCTICMPAAKVVLSGGSAHM